MWAAWWEQVGDKNNGCLGYGLFECLAGDYFYFARQTEVACSNVYTVYVILRSVVDVNSSTARASCVISVSCHWFQLVESL